MSDRLTTGIAYRLGWALFWVCLGVGALWIAGFVFLNWHAGQAWWERSMMWAVFALPPLLAYGLGRFFRYVLSDE